MSKHKTRVGGRFNTVTSCISTTMVLLLLGVVVFFTLVARNFSNAVRENFIVEVLLHDSISDAERTSLQHYLSAQPYARSVNYLSKEEGTRLMEEALADSVVEFEGYSPVPAEFEVYLNADYTHPDSITRFEPLLRERAYVLDVIYPRDMMDTVNEALPLISLVLLGLAILLTLISISLINNTMRMSVYARRQTIHSMKLVGAKWSFIRRPYLWRALLMGIVAAGIACALLMAGIYWLWGLHAYISTLVTPQVVTLTLGTVVVCGLSLTLLCAYVSVTRFLRMSEAQMMMK